MNEIWEDVLIRDFKRSDLDSLLEVANESFAEEFEISGFDPDRIREVVHRMFGALGKIISAFLRLFGKTPFKLLVAEVDGRVVASTMVNVREKVGYISTVMVHPLYRRRGIATELMKSALNYIRKKRLSRVVLHVLSTNSSAKTLYHKLGFRKFEGLVYLVADIDSLRKPENVQGIQLKDFHKKDTDAVYELIIRSEDPTHLGVFDFKKKDLKMPLINRLAHFSTDKKIVAKKLDEIVGYIHASYTTAKENGRITNIQVHPEMRLKGIEEMLIYASVNDIKKVGTNKVVATTLLERRELIEKMRELGFKKHLEIDAMVLNL